LIALDLAATFRALSMFIDAAHSPDDHCATALARAVCRSIPLAFLK
jgi:hypothetical protein